MSQNKLPIEGKWVSTMPHDSDDYLVEYIISQKGSEFCIRARDLQDDEEMQITEIKWDGEILSFKSFMASTERSGIARFRVKAPGIIEAKFTFTVLEELKKID